jgi:hypothetical protein
MILPNIKNAYRNKDDSAIEIINTWKKKKKCKTYELTDKDGSWLLIGVIFKNTFMTTSMTQI